MNLFRQSREYHNFIDDKIVATAGKNYLSNIFNWLEEDPISAIYSIAFSISMRYFNKFENENKFLPAIKDPTQLDITKKEFFKDIFYILWSPILILHELLSTNLDIKTRKIPICTENDLIENHKLQKKIFNEDKNIKIDDNFKDSIEYKDFLKHLKNYKILIKQDSDLITDINKLRNIKRIGEAPLHIKSVEILRQKIEKNLQKIYNNTKIKIKPILFFTDEDLTYPWQGQQSAILWIFIHTICAITKIFDNQKLNYLLYFIDNIQYFIQCGMCQNHWLKKSYKKWKMYKEFFVVDDSNIVVQNPYDVNMPIETLITTYFNEHAQDVKMFNPDYEMIETHDSINASNNKQLELTSAAKLGIVQDYIAFVKICIVEIQNTSKYEILDIEKKRDICIGGVELFKFLFKIKIENNKENLLFLSKNQKNILLNSDFISNNLLHN